MASTLLPPHASHLSDPTGSASSFWHRSAPKKAAKAYNQGKGEAAWKLWQEHLTERKFPTRLSKLFKGKQFPLAWSLPNEIADAPESDLIRCLTTNKRLGRSNSEKVVSLLNSWLADQQQNLPSLSTAVETLAIAYALPELAESCDAKLWWGIVANLQRAAQDADALQVNEKPLLSVWLASELPVVLAYMLPEVNACRMNWQLGGERFSAALIELLDGAGLPHAQHLSLVRPLLASAARAATLAAVYKEEFFTDDAQDQFELLVRRALELTKNDGSQLMTVGTCGKWEPELFQAVLALSGQRQNKAAAKASLPGYKSSQRKPVSGKSFSKCSNSSEWAELALLRSDWSPMSARMLVKYDSSNVEVELESARGTIFSGVWEVELEMNGKVIPVTGPWEEICWQSDHDVAYVELQTSLPGGLRVQRQIMLAREEQFLFLADAILGEHKVPIVYRGSLPLAENTEFQGDEETREGMLVGKKPQALVMPLALPEWRIDPRHGTLTSDQQRLTLTQRAEAQNLYCPLFLDLKPRRLGKLRTWRQLTVAENRNILPAETAVGYRAQSHKDQWFFYRSLGPQANRTLLSHNLVSEFLAARFETDGTIEELMEIE